MRPLPLEAGLQVLKAYNRCGSDWDPFAPSPNQVTLANRVGAQRGRRTLGELEVIDTDDDVESEDDHDEEYDNGFYGSVVIGGPYWQLTWDT